MGFLYRSHIGTSILMALLPACAAASVAQGSGRVIHSLPRDRSSLCAAPIRNGEDRADVVVIGMRLRFGTEQWDTPPPLVDLADINDASPLLWTDRVVGKIAGGSGLPGVPFRRRVSAAGGARCGWPSWRASQGTPPHSWSIRCFGSSLFLRASRHAGEPGL